MAIEKVIVLKMSLDSGKLEEPRMVSDQQPLNDLLQQLRNEAPRLKTELDWPEQQLKWCAEHGVFRWFSAKEWGGTAKSPGEIYQGYIQLASACLTTTFVITQRQGASRRIENSGNRWLAEQLIPDLNSGNLFATVGISHLTTSHRHLDKPVMRARKTGAGFVLDGFSPWVTGVNAADWVVIGATLEDGQQILIAVDTNLEGVTIKHGPRLVALSASQTGSIHFEQVRISGKYLVAGPTDNVMQKGVGGNTGGLQTSALALGLSQAAIEYLREEALKRGDLLSSADALQLQCQELVELLNDLAIGNENSGNREDLRRDANSLALRSTQAALAAAKGAGFVEGHPVGRWCREALFFLVWSCPQNVAHANLCEFAGILE